MTLTDMLELIKKRHVCGSDTHLARLIGVTPSALSHYKRGTRRPSLAHCDELARLLELDPCQVATMARERDRSGASCPHDRRREHTPKPGHAKRQKITA